MNEHTTIHKHGPDSKYKRTSIPVKISSALNLKLGDVIKWNIIDKNSAKITIINR